MFIYFVYLVESNFFFEFWSLFSASAVRGPSPHKGPLFTCTVCTVVCCWCWCLLLGLDMGGSVSSSMVRCRVALFGIKFDPWKKSKEDRNSDRRCATSGATMSEEHSDRRGTKTSCIRLNFSGGSEKGLEQKTLVY